MGNDVTVGILHAQIRVEPILAAWADQVESVLATAFESNFIHLGETADTVLIIPVSGRQSRLSEHLPLLGEHLTDLYVAEILSKTFRPERPKRHAQNQSLEETN